MWIITYKKTLTEGIFAAKRLSKGITLTAIRVLSENEFKGTALKEASGGKGEAAIDGKIELASGDEMFVRLFAFDNDRRVNKTNKCLLPESFTTTEDDYKKCKSTNDDPIQRFALPNDDEIKHTF